MDDPMDPKAPGDWEIDEDPATDPDQVNALTGQQRAPREDFVGQGDALNTQRSEARPPADEAFGARPGEPSGPGGQYPAMADQPAEGGEEEARN